MQHWEELSHARRGSWDGRSIERTIHDALREDRLGHGITVDNASLAAELDRVRGNGRPLPGWLADLMGRRLQRHFGDVRIHAGERVDQLTAQFRAAAFCVGSDIFLDHCVVRTGDPAFTRDVLCHELAHIANALEPGRIRCWDRDIHAKLTGEACKAFSAEFDELVKNKGLPLSKEKLVEGLKNACSNMDYRGRVQHLINTLRYGPDFVASWVAVHLFSSGFHLTDVPIIGPLFAKGEGPPHGEGKNYTEKNPKKNIEVNEEEQRKEIIKAAKRFTDDKAEEWIESLGNALHITQDRASHREGRKNFGHSDPRVPTGWSPDDPHNDDHRAHDGEAGHSWWICNQAALGKAFNNSCEVLEQFLDLIGFKPSHPWRRRSEVHQSVCWLASKHPTSCPPLGPHRPGAAALHYGWHKGCVYGQRSGPLGLVGRRGWPFIFPTFGAGPGDED